MTAASGKAEGGAELLLDALDTITMLRNMYGRPFKEYEAAKLNSTVARITAHLATPAANGPGEAFSDDALREYWRNAGGRFHGPNIETGTMPESELLPLLRRLLASTPQPGMVTVPREPTGNMIVAGADALYSGSGLFSVSARQAEKTFRAMLDAALRSGEKGTP